MAVNLGQKAIRRVRGRRSPLMEPRVGSDGAPAQAADIGHAVAVIAGAATAGAVLARILDWRGHAHPRI